jgi:hypothetical protein
MRRLLLPFIFVALSFSSLALFCSGLQPPVGGGTETVNTYAMLANGKPAAGARIYVIDGNGWIDSVRKGTSAILETAIADKNGRVTLKKRDSAVSINIQVDHAEQGLFLPERSAGSIEEDTLRLAPYASYAGAFDSSQRSLTTMLLSGSGYTSLVGANGFFSLTKVAPGSFAVLGALPSTGDVSPEVKIATSGAVTLTSGTTVLDAALNASFNRLLIDNFESGVGFSSLSHIFSSIGGWYAVCESGKWEWSQKGEYWQWTPFASQGGTCRSFIAMGPAPGANQGTALEFSAALDGACSYQYATAGIAFKGLNANDGVDLSAMTGFSIKVRGNGLLWIRFETRNLDSSSQNMSNYSYPVQLTSAWQSLAIPVDSLRILPAIRTPDQYPWSQESKSVIDIEFEFSKQTNRLGDTLHADLDDFYLEGVGIENLR